MCPLGPALGRCLWNNSICVSCKTGASQVALVAKNPSSQCRRPKRHEFSPWVGKICWRRHAYPLQYSCLENLMDRGAWPATDHRVAKSWTRLRMYTLPVKLCVLEKKKKSHSVVSDSLRPFGLYSPWNSPGQNTGMGSCSLLQGIFLTQGSNTHLPHCGRILYQLSHQGSPCSSLRLKNVLLEKQDLGGK